MEIQTPESVGMHSGRLERISTAMQSFVKDNQFPGILTLLQRRGAVVHLGKFGLMDIEACRPVQEDALFRIYSMTKPIVSVALMLLLEEGRLSLNDPVSNYIPAFKNTKVYDGSDALGMKLVDQSPVMTIHHLLTHTAGLSYGWFFDSPVEELYRQLVPKIVGRGMLLKDTIVQIAQLPLLFQPGSQWRYSVAVDVIGYLIQVLSDMPLGDFLAERIFKPLGMPDTFFTVPPDKIARLAQIYASPGLYDPVPLRPEDVPTIGDVTTPTNNPIGGGGLVSSLSDYLTFCNCLINQGKYDGGILIGRKTLAWMTANHIPTSLMPLKMGTEAMNHGFGLGFRVCTSLGEARTLTSVGEYGWSGLAKTYFWVDPPEEFIGIFLTQYLPLLPYPVVDRFRALAYAAIAD